MLHRAVPCWSWLTWLMARPRPETTTELSRNVLFSWWSEWRERRLRARVPEPSGADRRETIRYGINLETSTRLIASVEGDLGPVRVRNISAGGISLVLHRGVDPHTILHVQLLNRGAMYLCKIEVQVTYIVEHPSGDWILGGRFIRPLTEEQVKALLS